MLVCFLFTFNQYGFEYIDIDDQHVFWDNPRLEIDSISEALKLFVPQISHGVVEYMPVKDISLALDRHLFGIKSPFIRVQSFFWYGLSAVFCFLFVAHLFRQFVIRQNLKITSRQLYFLAFLLSLSFIVHPVHVNSWGWISSRKDLLSGAFGFVFLWSYLVFKSKTKLRFLLIAFLSYALALLAKPTSAFLPLVLFGYEILYLKKEEIFSFKTIRKFNWLIVLSVFTLLYAIWYHYLTTAQFQIGSNSQWEESVILPYSCLPLWIVQFAHYIRMAVLPYGIMLLQVYEFPAILSFDFVSSTVLVLILLISCIWGLYKNRLVSFGVLFFVLSLLPTIATNPFEQYWATRYFFFGVFGILLIFAALILQYEKVRPKHFMLIIAVILSLGMLGHAYSNNFASSIKLWKYHTDVKIDHWTAYKRLAKAYYNDRQFDKSLASFAKCSHFRPESLECAIAQGELMFLLLPDDLKQQAIDVMLNLTKQDGSGHVLRKLAPMYWKMGKSDKALQTYAEGFNNKQWRVEDMIEYAEFLWEAGRRELAMKKLDLVDSVRESWEPDTVELRRRWKKELSL